MKRLLVGYLAVASLAATSAASAATITPELAIMRYWTSAGNALWVKQTSAFYNRGSCGTNCTLYYADRALSSERQNEIQLRLKSNESLMPATESCWYYDHDGPTNAWRPTTYSTGCISWTPADGKERTWMSESNDLMNGNYEYWTVHYYPTNNSPVKPYMAYGYYENNTWKWIWVYGGGYFIT